MLDPEPCSVLWEYQELNWQFSSMSTKSLVLCFGPVTLASVHQAAFLCSSITYSWEKAMVGKLLCSSLRMSLYQPSCCMYSAEENTCKISWQSIAEAVSERGNQISPGQYSPVARLHCLLPHIHISLSREAAGLLQTAVWEEAVCSQEEGPGAAQSETIWWHCG